ncbi:unnamed protein product [Pedinophyceae sp. YPF-701]|nr:unnamed protein product [Pedinophyceae sp. YPF-701]
MPPRRAPTAYFLFSHDERAAATEEWRAKHPDKQSVAVAEVASILGERWRALPDDAKARYQEQAAARAAELAEQVAQEEVEREEHAEAQTAAKTFAFPLTTVKKIILADSEIKRVAKDAALTLNKACELWLGALAAGAAGAARDKGRRTVRLEDLTQAMSQDPALYFCREHLATYVQPEVEERQEERKAALAAAKKKQGEAEDAGAPEGGRASGDENAQAGGGEGGVSSARKRSGGGEAAEGASAEKKKAKVSKREAAAANTRSIATFFTKP